MRTPRHPDTRAGYHCARFDTRLLEEIVDVDLDCALAQLRNRTGLMINADTRREWRERIIARLEEETFSDLASHSFLPSVLNERLKRCIETLIRAETAPPVPALPAAPARGLTSLWATAYRLLFEKRLE